MRLLRYARNDEVAARNDEVAARSDEVAARSDTDSVIARRPKGDDAIRSIAFGGLRRCARNDRFMLMTGLVLVLAAVTAQASDRSIRCGSNLIYAGGGKDSSGMYEVLKKCGEPVAKHGNTWIYEQGNMNRVLTFNHQGRLQTIESRRK